MLALKCYTHAVRSFKLSHKPIVVNEFRVPDFIELREKEEITEHNKNKPLSYTYSYQNDEPFNEKDVCALFSEFDKGELFR